MNKRNYEVFIKVKGDESLYCVPITAENRSSQEVYHRYTIGAWAKAWLNNHFPILPIDDMEVINIHEKGRAIKNITQEDGYWVIEDVKGYVARYMATIAECEAKAMYLRGQLPQSRVVYEPMTMYC